VQVWHRSDRHLGTSLSRRFAADDTVEEGAQRLDPRVQRGAWEESSKQNNSSLTRPRSAASRFADRPTRWLGGRGPLVLEER
jgi:hypothetical protein